ncbi:MAG: tRNA lysidine(34) synthetase TilS [Elusimicrobia bacterium]|nr:tRNA lysidine(34) synthetase TilS [Elusimicrobiota bacterium]
MIQKIKRFIDKYELLGKNDRVLVGLSGGPDSVFLIHALLQLKGIYKTNLCACHIDHQYRKNSYKDADFVINFCKKLDIPVVVRKIKLKRFSEEKARDLRYKIFEEIAKKYKCTKIATGHTLDDNAETVIMWMVRGCGLKGLKGIPPRRGKIIRPILCISKKEILSYLKKNGIKYCTDRTNFTSKFVRNKIRLKILPLLEELNPKIKAHIFNLSGILSKKSNVDTSGEKYYNRKVAYSSPEKRVFFDADKISIKKIKIRKWKEGDKMVPFGMTGSKKLQDIFTDSKVPREMRKEIPVVSCNNKILWVAGIKRSNDAKVTDSTENVLKMELKDH